MKRIATAAVLIPIVVFAIFGGFPWLFLGVIAAIAGVSYFEYASMLKLGLPLTVIGLAAGFLLLELPPQLTFLPLVLLACAALALPLDSGADAAAFHRSSAMFLGVLYIFGAFRLIHLLGLRDRYLLLFALAINWVGDSAAYYFGRAFGKHKMAPRISPGKSWEGALASVLVSTVFFVLVAPRFAGLSRGEAALIAVVGNAVGQIGDLAESALKRSVGVKDSGATLPGHGGMLDRVDSALFTLPVTYALLTWWPM